jgi:folate-binding protein YgfZ
MAHVCLLPDRGVIEVAGADRVGFLQGLVSNDVTLAGAGRAVWAALLTPQGKYLADFFILAEGERLLLDCAAAQVGMVVQKLSRFRLRAAVTVRDVPAEWRVYAAWGGAPVVPAGCVAAADPRLEAAGWRILSREELPVTADAVAWDRHRLALGLPEPGDLEVDKSVLLEAGFDELNGVSWTKGCYMGQELTARTKYRGLIKRRLLPVEVRGELPPPGTPVLADGREVGTLRTGREGRAMATLRVDALEDALTCLGVAVLVARPDWMRV